MNKYILLVMFWMCSSVVFAQIVFEKGYFIDNEGQKTECLIKDSGWHFNPDGFDYKLSENAEVKKSNIQLVKEFGIGDHTKYIRAKVDIDRSEDNPDKLSKNRNPEFSNEILFLKVLIEGDASLYIFQGPEIRRFFFSVDSQEITQLVFKIFSTELKGIGYNYQFRQQLFTSVNCNESSAEKVRRLNYYENELRNYFIGYNKCKGQYLKIYDNSNQGDNFKLSLRPGVNLGHISLENTAFAHLNYDFGVKAGLRIGAEAEFVLPFNKQKWTLIAELSFHKLSNKYSDATIAIDVDYKSLELPVGIRYYMFTGKKTALFLNVKIVPCLSLKSAFSLPYGESIDISTLLNYAAGAGFKYQDRLSMEIRYYSPIDLTTKYMKWYGSYSAFSIIAGYTLF
jgi:hypothetical protein